MNTLDYAIEYLKKGFSIIPVRGAVYAGQGTDEEQYKNSKLPLIPWSEFQKRLPTEKEVKDWYKQWPRAGIAIITGSISGIVVVDFDSEEVIKKATDAGILNTPMVNTGRGLHAYYKYPHGKKITNSANASIKIDIRGEGGYAIAPPTIHFSGKRYEWVKGFDLQKEISKLPEIFLQNNDNNENITIKNKDAKPLKKLYKGVKTGERNVTLARLCGSWVNDGLTFEECMENALLWNSKNPDPLDIREIENTVKSILKIHTNDYSKKSLMYHEVHLLRMPLFQIETQETQNKIEIYEKNRSRDRTWIISNNYGTLNPFDESVFMAIHEIIRNQPIPLKNPINIGSPEKLAEALQLEPSTSNQHDIIASIEKIASLTISSYNRFNSETEKEVLINDHFRIYDRVVVKKMNNECSIDIWINEIYAKNIYENQFTVDFQTYILLTNDIARSLYKLLYPIFYSNNFLPVSLKYSTICQRIGLKQEKDFQKIKEQLFLPHKELKDNNIIESAFINTKNMTTYIEYKPKKQTG